MATAGQKTNLLMENAEFDTMYDVAQRPVFGGLTRELGMTSAGLPIQAKMRIGEANDRYEQEANRLATLIVQQINTSEFGEKLQGSKSETQKDTPPKQVQVLRPMLQLKNENTGGDISPAIESAITRARGGGQPLKPELQELFGKVMKADLSGVRVHTDAQADTLSCRLGARAFTTGKDIFFKYGEYQPENQRGQELIAHETAHVIQQKGIKINSSRCLASIQREIYYTANILNPQFQINNIRPNWIGQVSQWLVFNGRSKNHIIAFEHIQNDLCIILNEIIANIPNSINRLINLTDSLYSNTQTIEYGIMINHRNQLLNAIQNNQTFNYQQLAQTLLSDINSSPDNVRLGDAGINLSIGVNIDADFLAGTFFYTGPVQTVKGTPFVHNLQHLRLTPNSNSIVYRYQSVTNRPLHFILNGRGGALNQAVPNGMHLSSGALPTVFNRQNPFPVLVTDPNGLNAPFLYI